MSAKHTALLEKKVQGLIYILRKFVARHEQVPGALNQRQQETAGEVSTDTGPCIIRPVTYISSCDACGSLVQDLPSNGRSLSVCYADLGNGGGSPPPPQCSSQAEADESTAPHLRVIHVPQGSPAARGHSQDAPQVHTTAAATPAAALAAAGVQTTLPFSNPPLPVTLLWKGLLACSHEMVSPQHL